VQSAAAFSILAMTVGLSLRRPVVGRLQIQPPVAAIIGACLTMALGLVSLPELGEILRLLRFPIITLVSLMAMTLVAEQVGLFRLLASRVATLAHGDGRKLFAALFFAATITGTFFTNDAAILIFTPMVFDLVEEVEDPSWTATSKIPFYFAVLYIANLVGPLVISNPINIIVASVFGIGFLDYAAWMIVPAVVSIVTSFLGLRFVFRRTIPASYRMPAARSRGREHRGSMIVTGVVLAVTLLGLFSEHWTGLPAWLVAASGAITLIVLWFAIERAPVAPIVTGIGWDVIVFVLGIFVVASGLRNAGLTDVIGRMLIDPTAPNLFVGTMVTGFVAAGFSAVMNNHPTASIMALAIQDLGLPSTESTMLAFAALIGGDLGPKMLPIGSLAALLWFRILRSRGVPISYALYIKIGIPVTLFAVLLSLLTLNVERLIVGTFP
jgi:arsenical pump membrane protein